jgi:predicted amidohydrolase YtcJ
MAVQVGPDDDRDPGETLVFRGRHDSATVAVSGGTIVALGHEALAGAPGGGRTRVVDVGDGTIVPAFRDGHLHPLWGGYWKAGVPLDGATSVDDLLRRVAEHAHEHPARRWITGAGYDPALLPGGLGTAQLLDQVVDDRPVLLWASDHHSGWANSAALSVAGITDTTADPDGGRFVRHPDGSPTGALLEEAAQQVAAHAPLPTGADKELGLRRALLEMVAQGIVWGLDASVAPSDVAVYARLAAAGGLPCPMALALRADPQRWRDQRADFNAIRSDVGGGPGDALAVTSVKFFADGILEAGTADLVEPYADDPCSHGIANWEPSELALAVAAFDADGFGVHIHAIGDGAVRSALDAIERAGRVNGARDRRAVIAHAQLVQPEDLPRFAPLGVITNFQPLWAQRDRVMTRLTEPRLGWPRTAWQYPIGGLARLGARISFGSDWPVTSMRPLDGLAVAVSRQTSNGEPPGGWLPEQRLSIDRALAAYTEGVAFQAFEESLAGRLAVGQRADLCLLSADPRSVHPSQVAGLDVLGTWSAGVDVFRT